jgi:putative ABC transport system ATP-binding protein
VADGERVARGGDAVTGPLLEARSVSKAWRAGGRLAVALDGVSLVVPRGAFAALSGPSGSGKSTLLAVLGALERPSSGTALFEGRDLGAVSEAERTRVRRRIGFVFQASPALRGLPLWENVALALVPAGVPRGERRARAEALLERVGLAARADARPETLSAGEAQRAGLARALVLDPAVVLADEPTSHLDRASATLLADLLGALHASGTTLLVATHDPRLLARAGTTFELDGGRLAGAPGAPRGGGGPAAGAAPRLA